MPPESPAEEIRRLQRCINDLLSVLALPAVWAGHEPAQIANVLLDALVRILQPDFVYVRLSDAVDPAASEWVRSPDRRDIAPGEIGRALGQWLTVDAPDRGLTLPNPLGEGQVTIASFRLGLQGDLGRLIAGSQRDGFPTAIEQLLMQVAANEAALGLQEARYVRQQRLATQELERRVVERTAELAAANAELRREILERTRAEALNRDLAGRLIASQETERQRMARELHDDVSQKIALLNIDIDQIAAAVEADEHRSRLKALSARAGEIARAVHGLSHELHPAKLQMLGLVPALQALCRDVSQQGDVDIDFSHDVPTEAIDPGLSLCLYRIAQEALHNVARHSHARNACVRLHGDREHVFLRITDSGIGFDAGDGQRPGLGLISMRERVAFVKGQLTIHSSPGEGTEIVVRVPIAAPESAAAGAHSPTRFSET